VLVCHEFGHVQVSEEIFVNVRIGHVRGGQLRVGFGPDGCLGGMREGEELALQYLDERR
jgi:hypothetical protein